MALVPDQKVALGVRREAGCAHCLQTVPRQGSEDGSSCGPPEPGELRVSRFTLSLQPTKFAMNKLGAFLTQSPGPGLQSGP